MPLRRLLCSAERFSESAIFLGFADLKTFGCRSSALLRCVTLADQRRLPWCVVALRLRDEGRFDRPRCFDDLCRDCVMSNGSVSSFSSHRDAAFALFHDLESEALVEAHGWIIRRGANRDC